MELSIKPDTVQDLHDFLTNLDALNVPRDIRVSMFGALTVSFGEVPE